MNRRAAAWGLAGMLAPRGAAARPAVPDGACDCHVHIYDPRYPYHPEAAVKPPPAPAALYRRAQLRMGTSRTVFVTPPAYGTDNRALADVLARFGAAARGVAVVDARTPDAALIALDAAGVRGACVNLGTGRDAVDADAILPLALRIHALGWHMQFWMPPARLAALGPLLQHMPVPMVFDHMGHVPEPGGLNTPAYRTVRRLLDTGRAWVKLSAAYIDSRSGPPHYRDSGALARSYIAAAPERMLWGSNWPFAELARGPRPDPVQLLALLAEWAPAAARRRILVENPEALYGFDPQSRPKAFR